MTTNNKELDQTRVELQRIFDQMNDGHLIDMPLSPGEAITRIEALIQDRITEARIDELNHIISGSDFGDDDFNWYEKTREEYTGTKYYNEVYHLDKAARIATLQAQLEKRKV